MFCRTMCMVLIESIASGSDNFYLMCLAFIQFKLDASRMKCIYVVIWIYILKIIYLGDFASSSWTFRVIHCLQRSFFFFC